MYWQLKRIDGRMSRKETPIITSYSKRTMLAFRTYYMGHFALKRSWITGINTLNSIDIGLRKTKQKNSEPRGENIYAAIG